MSMDAGASVAASPPNKYLYNSKELQTDLGLNWYEYGFRMYDPVITRFTGVDPIANQFPWVTTYNYAENEPIANIDLHGLQKAGMHLVLQKSREHIKNTKSAQDVADFDNAVAQNESRARTTAAVIATSFIPGPEDLAIGAFLLTKAGQATTRALGTLSKYADDLWASGKKFFSKADESTKVTDAYLKQRADEINNALPDQIARDKRTAAVSEVTTKDGKTQIWVSSSEKSLSKGQKAALKEGEIPVSDGHFPKVHAEITIDRAAKLTGAKVERTAASRPICDNCLPILKESGTKAINPGKKK